MFNFTRFQHKVLTLLSKNPKKLDLRIGVDTNNADQLSAMIHHKIQLDKLKNHGLLKSKEGWIYEITDLGVQAIEKK